MDIDERYEIQKKGNQNAIEILVLVSAELDNARDVLKLTYEELSERTGLSQSTVHSALRIHKEKGAGTESRLSSFIKISEAMGMDFFVLIDTVKEKYSGNKSDEADNERVKLERALLLEIHEVRDVEELNRLQVYLEAYLKYEKEKHK